MRKKNKLVILGFFVFTAVFVATTGFGLFSIKRISITSEKINCASEEQLSTTSKLAGQNILFIQKDQLQEDLIKKYPCIKTVTFRKIFPNSVQLNINGRLPIAKVASFSDSLELKLQEASPSSTSALLDWSFPSPAAQELSVIDETGIIFENEEVQDLPIIFLKGENLYIGRTLNSEMFNKISQIFYKIRGLKDWGEADKNFRSKVIGNYLLIEGNPRLVFSLEKDSLRSVASLQLILYTAKINGKQLEAIDLRFDKPVVVYSQKKD